MEKDVGQEKGSMKHKATKSQKIIPCLWFDGEAVEAANYYTGIFENSSLGSSAPYRKAGHEIHHQPQGRVMSIGFDIEGYQFLGLNGGPQFTFTPAISFFVHCDTPEEVQSLWEQLIKGGTPLMPLDRYDWSDQYGWVQDRYGLSWQLMASRDEITQKIVPSLLFVGPQAGRAEEAIQHYANVFENSSVGQIARYGPGQEPNQEGTIMYADFRLQSQQFVAMDSAQEHAYSFNEAISFMVNCDTQEEIDYYWEELSAVPEAEQCGWLKDKFGVSWQIVPAGMQQMFTGNSSEHAERAMKAMLQMKKLDIATLEQAFHG